MYPRVIKQARTTDICFIEPNCTKGGRIVAARCVLDFDDDGEMIGIEIINLMHRLGKQILNAQPWRSKGIEYSYDDAADAFYVRLSNNRRSTKQKAVACRVILDDEGSMKGLVIDSQELE